MGIYLYSYHPFTIAVTGLSADGCPDGFEDWKPGYEYCFYWGSEANTLWSEARGNCTEMGGDLAKIPNEQVNRAIMSAIHCSVVWAGLKRETGELKKSMVKCCNNNLYI